MLLTHAVESVANIHNTDHMQGKILLLNTVKYGHGTLFYNTELIISTLHYLYVNKM